MQIKNRFRIIGAAEAAANLLWEFKIAEKKEDKLTNNKNGKVILVREIVKSNLSEYFSNPGAITKTKDGMNISIIKTIKNKLINNKLNILFANFVDLFFPEANSDE